MRGARARVRSRLPLRNTSGRLREVYPLRWKTNRRRRKRTLLGTSVADKLTKAILPRPSRPPHYRKPVDSRTICTVKSPTRERAQGERGKRDRETKRDRNGMKSFSIWRQYECSLSRVHAMAGFQITSSSIIHCVFGDIYFNPLITYKRFEWAPCAHYNLLAIASFNFFSICKKNYFLFALMRHVLA